MPPIQDRSLPVPVARDRRSQLKATTSFKVVIAVDSSDIAYHAAEYYFKYVYQSFHQVVVFHAGSAPKLPTLSLKSPMAPPVPEWKETLETANKEKTDLENKYYGLKVHTDPKMNYSWDCAIGNPGELICTEAEKVNANLVVIGNRGLNKIRRTFMGSVSEYVLHHSNSPVMVIPKGTVVSD